ncbi:MAG: hypothetical protein M1835_004968 [Candelina submexicana]|nr:MAG: hypothetical protein M1835_004968 [Candelina submexicana]
MSTSVLLKGGTILSHGTNDHITPLRVTDLLIQGNRITKIASGIEAPDDAQVIDCKDKIVSPGFIDTHHHIWQTQLKGRHADETFLQYMPSGGLQGSNYTPVDIFWGQHGGCLEAIDSGTTTVVDHAHMNYSPEHARNALSATVSSGIRSFFCYTPTMRVKSWTPEMEINTEDLLPIWIMDQLEELGRQAPFGEGRVELGFAFDLLFLPKEMVIGIFERARKIGVKLITLHYVNTGTYKLNNYLPKVIWELTRDPGHSYVDLLSAYGLLRPDMLVSHASNASASDASKLKQANIFISSTPDTELQMVLGDPVCFRPDFKPISSLGIDCHSNNSASIVSQMRLGMQSARGKHNQAIIDTGKTTTRVSVKVEEAFNLGTINGARAVHMEDEIGSLAEGKLADIVILDALSPGMCCAAQHDPVAAIVLHSSVRDIDTVIVNGEIRKQNGKLLPTKLEKQVPEVGGGEVQWPEVARQLLKSRADIEKRIEGTDFERATKAALKIFGGGEDMVVNE